MLRPFVCAAMVSGALPAAAEMWSFTYTGFHDAVAGTFLPERRLTGSFTGADGDGDGIIGRHELTALLLNGYDYVACESQSNEYWHCGTERFSYTPGGALDFAAGQWGDDPEGWVGAGHFYTAGDSEYIYRYRPGYHEEWRYEWTSATAFAIAPVPEPATWMLLAAGLPLALTRRRHRKK